VRHRQPAVVLLGGHSDGDGVDPYRSAGNAAGNGQRHDAWSHATHRLFHGGGDISSDAQNVDMVRPGPGPPGGLRPGKTPSSG
jgi:hypothetical protein